MVTSAECPICKRLPVPGGGDHSGLIAELGESFVVLADPQGYPGWCILLLKEHVEHLTDLPIARQEKLFGEVARVANAIRAVLSPRRLNYECLGNEVAHVHWHLIPRHADDPQPTGPIWVRPPAERAGTMSAERRRELIGQLRAEMDVGR
jgi:diadenosine tetraphosphate (Ap4A) HIT family hydrolase